MARIAVINTRVDPEVKSRAQAILNALGIPMSEAISMFLRQVVYKRGIPFELKIPNEITIETFSKTDAGKELHRVSGVDELMKELKA